jgi:hypothetical protein
MGKCSVHRNIPLSPRCARTLPFGRAGRRGPDGARRRADAARRSASRTHRGAPVWDAMRTRSLHSASLALGSGHAASILYARQSAPGADVRPQSISKSRKSVQPLRNGLNAALAARRSQQFMGCSLALSLHRVLYSIAALTSCFPDEKPEFPTSSEKGDGSMP